MLHSEKTESLHLGADEIKCYPDYQLQVAKNQGKQTRNNDDHIHSIGIE